MCGVTQLGEGEIEYARMVPLLTVRPSDPSGQNFLASPVADAFGDPT